MAVQAKRYAKPVGVKAVQEVAAARSFYGASGAAVITNGAFTPAARRLAASCRVELWDTQWLESALRAAYLSPAPVAPATAPQMARP